MERGEGEMGRRYLAGCRGRGDDMGPLLPRKHGTREQGGCDRFALSAWLTMLRRPRAPTSSRRCRLDERVVGCSLNGEHCHRLSVECQKTTRYCTKNGPGRWPRQFHMLWRHGTLREG